MKRVLMAGVLALAACGQKPDAVPADLDGRWDVQQIAGASLGQGVDIWIAIDAQTGVISGFTGCNNFSATMTSFGNALSVGAVTEEPGECASAEAGVDEARFLGVIGHVRRRARRGQSLELLEAAPGGEALLRLRREEPLGG